MSRLPFLELASDVVNVVYCTWVVDVANVAHLVPPGVALSQREGKALFTILTYAHRHFGPRIAGPLRRLFPSPLQSNWRLYVDTFPGGTGSSSSSTVLFVKNVFDHPLYAIGTRLFSDALPSHLAQRFEHTVSEGRFHTILSGGGGSAPDFRCDTVSAIERALPTSLKPFFDSWRSAVTFLCLQHGAIAYVEDGARLAHARIDLPIDIDTVQALEPVGSLVGGDFLERIGAVDQPFCFVVPKVAFRVLSERLI
ncbi:DUF2071 domain-containing protein [Trinickia fusca]|uniref:DUF2071 domain-containing protein n=1 Tax=Trinickia fusca TaxID=2419777 RepID=UPI001FE64907|nr:DUF2071 domain-containing protein [Trinickia fusca]